MNRAYKYRIYPTREQEQQMVDTFGCCRFVYNHYLALQTENYREGRKQLSKMNCNNDCNRVLKDANPWLRDVDKFALTNAVYALANGFQRFFQKQGGYPKFKSRHHSRMSYTTNFTNHNIEVMDYNIKLPKLGKVRASVHRKADESWKLKQATISRESDGCYYVSILYEYQREEVSCSLDIQKAIGLDYKSKGLYMDSEGVCCDMDSYYRNSQKKLAKAQRKLKHKYLHSGNYRKQQRRISKIMKKAANQRKDFLHKKSTEIANQYDLVCAEDLNMRSMSNKKFGNGKSTLDNGYGSFLTMLEYKLDDRGKKLIKVDRRYPSSKTCSRCGRVKIIPLSERIYHCQCGMEMDRDLNAAINIKNKGIEIYTKQAA